jgi:hypothetical protein
MTPPTAAIWRALDSCNAAQRETFAAALVAVTDDLRRAGLRSPEYWHLLGILDGEAPVPPETKALAARRLREVRAG